MIVWVPFCFGTCFLTRCCPLSPAGPQPASGGAGSTRCHHPQADRPHPGSRPEWLAGYAVGAKSPGTSCRGFTRNKKRITAGQRWKKIDDYFCKVEQVNNIRDWSYFLRSSPTRQRRLLLLGNILPNEFIALDTICLSLPILFLPSCPACVTQTGCNPDGHHADLPACCSALISNAVTRALA